MRNLILFTLVSLLILSCKQENKPQTDTIEDTITETTPSQKKIETKKSINDTPKPTGDHTELLGYYVGSFNADDYENVYEKKGSFSNKINIAIDAIKNDSIHGHSVVAGNSRPFKGIINVETLSVKVTEPGDNKYDGIFEFTISSEKNTITGIWIANDKNLAVPKRKYDLNKKEFAYEPELNLDFNIEYDYNLSLSDSQLDENGEMEAINPKVIGKLNASTQTLKNTDVENLNKGELEVLRNLIYARHGYSFKNRKVRYFFDSQIEWYIPISTDIRDQLTSIEKKNIDLIKRYEQHAERYYDYFGR